MGQGSSSIGAIRKKITKTYELISCAYHESSHTVYSLLHMMRVSSVVVFENKKAQRIQGITYYEYPCDFDGIQDPELLNLLVRADIGMSYAGLLGEKVLFRSISGSKQIPMFICDGSRDDNKGAGQIIKKYNLAPPGKKRAAFKLKLMREVRNELHQHWEAITLVAHALFQHRKLTYQDLQELLTKKCSNKKFWQEQFEKINNFYDNSKIFDENQLKILLS